MSGTSRSSFQKYFPPWVAAVSGIPISMTPLTASHMWLRRSPAMPVP